MWRKRVRLSGELQICLKPFMKGANRRPCRQAENRLNHFIGLTDAPSGHVSHGLEEPHATSALTSASTAFGEGGASPLDETFNPTRENELMVWVRIDCFDGLLGIDGYPIR